MVSPFIAVHKKELPYSNINEHDTKLVQSGIFTPEDLKKHREGDSINKTSYSIEQQNENQKVYLKYLQNKKKLEKKRVKPIQFQQPENVTLNYKTKVYDISPVNVKVFHAPTYYDSVQEDQYEAITKDDYKDSIKTEISKLSVMPKILLSNKNINILKSINREYDDPDKPDENQSQNIFYAIKDNNNQNNNMSNIYLPFLVSFFFYHFKEDIIKELKNNTLDAIILPLEDNIKKISKCLFNAYQQGEIDEVTRDIINNSDNQYAQKYIPDNYLRLEIVDLLTNIPNNISKLFNICIEIIKLELKIILNDSSLAVLLDFLDKKSKFTINIDPPSNIAHLINILGPAIQDRSVYCNTLRLIPWLTSDDVNINQENQELVTMFILFFTIKQIKLVNLRDIMDEWL